MNNDLLAELARRELARRYDSEYLAYAYEKRVATLPTRSSVSARFIYPIRPAAAHPALRNVLLHRAPFYMLLEDPCPVQHILSSLHPIPDP